MLVLSIALFVYTALNVSADTNDLMRGWRGVSRRLAADIITDGEVSGRPLIEVSTIAFDTLFSSKPKYALSDVTIGPNKEIVAICENSWSLFFTEEPGQGTGEGTKEVQPSTSFDKGDDVPDWETIVFAPQLDRYIMVRESLDKGDGSYVSSFIEATIGTGEWNEKVTCTSDVPFKWKNKGFEGGLYFSGPDINTQYFLGLCEGNFCEGGRRGKKEGNGMMKLMQKIIDGPDCSWNFVKDVHIPKVVTFKDYSSIAIRGSKVAITSRDSSALFIGSLQGLEVSSMGATLSDPVPLLFSETDADIYLFPRDPNGAKKFCTIAGIEFLSDKKFVAVSDKARDSTDPLCRDYDQSMHIFELPEAPME